MSTRMYSLFITLALVLGLASCSDDTKQLPDGSTTPDMAQKDSGSDATPDKGPLVDQAPSVDNALPDAAASLCNSSLDLKPLTLDTAYCVVYRAALAAAINAFNFKGDTVWTFTGSGTSFVGKVEEAAIDAKTGKLGAASSVFSFTPTITGTIYAGGYLAASPKGFLAAGVTEGKTFTGEIFWGDKGIKTPKKVDKANGNFSVVFLDDSTLLINGTGVGSAQSGQGVYWYKEGQTPRLLIKDMGVASGDMALGAKTVYAGGYFTGGSKLYGFSLAEIKAAISGSKTLSASTDGDLIHSGSISGAAALGDDVALLTLDSAWKFKAVTHTIVIVTGDKLTSGAPTDLVQAGGTTAVSGLAASGNRLGLYLTDSTKQELAFIIEK